MTRINVIPVEELTREHLVAEYRELPRVFALIRNAVARGESPNDRRNPRNYVLGTGHVRFFYNKINWLVRRFDSLVAEMRRRGYEVNFPRAPAHDLPFTNVWNVTYEPSEGDLALNRFRIAANNEISLLKRLQNNA